MNQALITAIAEGDFSAILNYYCLVKIKKA